MMMDLIKAFEDMGHTVLVVKAHEIEDMVANNVPGETILQAFAGVFLEPKCDFIFGYGAVPLIGLRMKDRGVVNLFEELKLPYLSIYYDSPMHSIPFEAEYSAYYSRLHYRFIWDRYYSDEMQNLGFANVHYMPIGTNTRRYKKLDERAAELSGFQHDVSFVGNWSVRREIVIRKLMPFNPVIYGVNWDQKARGDIKQLYRRKVDNVTELPFIYNYSKVNINTTMEQGISSLNMRIFDVIACEGFLITDYKKDLEELFDIEKEIVCYRHVDELPGLVGYYLEHEDERKTIARAARRRALREHSYKNRAEFILNILRADGIGV